MFEAVITLCLGLSEEPCRDHLLPGAEASTQAACEGILSTDGFAQTLPDGLVAQGSARCEQVGKTLDFIEVAPGVFAHRGAIEEPNAENKGDVTNLGFVIGARSVAVIDTGTARWMGEATWRAVRARTDLPIGHVILTHMHPDHVLGASLFADAGAEIVGHAALPRALSDRAPNYLESLERLVGAEAFLGTRAVAIDRSVDDGLEIDLGGRVLEIKAWPAAHTGTDVTVFDRASGTMFTGDLVFHEHTPALDGRLLGWQAVLAEVTEMAVTRIVPGHGGPILDWPESAEAMERYLSVLERDTRAAIDAGQRLGEAVEEIAQSEAEHWQLFDAYNPRNATVAFTELEWE